MNIAEKCVKLSNSEEFSQTFLHFSGDVVYHTVIGVRALFSLKNVNQHFFLLEFTAMEAECLTHENTI